ncbi:hypothetical protein [Altererythrobacter fulvus]|uniref:hypothetical protein n=1 Tax=Caenibius fulvus TaxID=2126012 RepID=UPI00301649E1
MSGNIAGAQSAGKSYEAAREATRRAVFLNVARSLDSGEEHRQGLAAVFQACRERALEAGAACGMTTEQVDADISQICDEDVVSLRAATDEEFRAFANESGEVVQRFLLG